MARSIGIRVFKGDALSDEHVFERDIIKIGRLASAHLRLEDTKVSRIHAVIDISQTRDEVSIIDMGSAEGTRVNSEKVSRVRLKHGDEVGLGDSRLVIVLEPSEIAAMGGELAGEGSIISETPAVDASSVSVSLTIDDEVTNANFSPGPMSEFPMEAIGDAPHSMIADETAVGMTPDLPSAAPPPAPPPTADFDTPDVNFGEGFAPPMTAARAPTAPASAAPSRPAPATAAPSDAIAAPAEGHADGVRAAAPVAPPSPAAAPMATAAPPHSNVPMVAVGQPIAPLPPIPVDPITPANRFVEVSLRWGSTVTDVKRVRDAKNFVIGSLDKCDLFVPLTDVGGEKEHTLLTNENDRWVVHALAGMNGSVQQRGREPRPLRSLGGSFPLEDDMRVEIAVGPFTIEVAPVSKSRIIPIAPFLDTLALNIGLVTMFAFASIMSVMTLMPNTHDDGLDDLGDNAAEFKMLILKPPPKNNDFLDRLNKKKSASAAAKKKQSKAGAKKKVTKNTQGRMAVKAKKKTDEEVVASKLSQLFGSDGNAGIASVFGANVGGGDLEAALGGVQSNRVAAIAGEGGLGIRGATGGGGGGTGINTVGIGKIGTRGRASGDATFGNAEGGLGKKVDRDVRISQGKPLIVGSLDKEIIRRVVREHMAQIKYCYERELTRSPGLYGKIIMKWVINGNGSVSRATVASTTMKNKQVEGCIASKIRTWRFPKPKGGGIVIVNYPFVFKQSG